MVELLRALPVPALLLHGPDSVTLYNDRCAALIGDLHPALMGTALAKGWPALEAIVAPELNDVRNGRTTIIASSELVVSRDGRAEQICLKPTLTPIYGRTASVLAVLVMLEDVTWASKRNRWLRRDATRMAAIFEQAQVGLSEISLSSAFMRVNSELCRMLGRPRETLLTLGVPDVTHKDDIAQSLTAVRRLIEDGKPVSIDKRYVRPDGTIVWANSSISRLEPAGPGAPYSLLAVTVDLTERTLARQALAESEARFRALAEAAPVLIWQLDAQGAIAYQNPRCHEILGAGPIAGRNEWHALLHDDDAKNYLQSFETALGERHAFKSRARFHAVDGSMRWLESYMAPWFKSDGAYAGHVGISIDITDNVNTQQRLMIVNDRLNLALDGSGDGVWDWNIVDDEITYSRRMKEIVGCTDQSDVESHENFCRRVHPDDLAQTQAILQECLDGATPAYSAEYRMRCKEGAWKWILARAIVVARDASGKALRMTGTVTDISDERQSQEVIWLHANFDALTGLPNRRMFRDRLAHEVMQARRTGKLLGLLFIDLDHFKEANDLLGHDAGDQLLAQAARRILARVRQTDTVARLGGDEFTAILPQLADPFDAEKIAREINQELVEPFLLSQEVIYLSASIGITIFPTDGAEPEALIRNADQAMYVAKNSGRNRFNYFTQTMQNEAQDRLRLIADLRHALAANELEVYYQPVLELRTRRVVKAEALLRWKHPRLGFLMPADFIPYAEESGLITEIGDWVFQQAAACAKQWRRHMGESFQVSVNRSPVQFMARAGGSHWPSYLDALGLSGGSMAVEITEAVLLNTSSRVTDQLQQYHAAGMQVAIDDFGTGYSSLSYLKKFDIDYLKIDQAFIRDMERSEDDRAIVRSVTAMAHELGLQVIAEGIETPEQEQLLEAAGCDFGQGFYFSKPMPAARFAHLLIVTGHGGLRLPCNP